jgi:hypothetical protein
MISADATPLPLISFRIATPFSVSLAASFHIIDFQHLHCHYAII